MDKIGLNGARGRGKYVIVDEEAYDFLNQFKWYLDSGGYAVRGYSIIKKEKGWIQGRIRMHNLLKPLPTTYSRKILVDHINRDKLDNREVNLRYLSSEMSSRNVTPHGTSKFIGVHKNHGGRWIASASVKKKTKYLGSFNTEIGAAKARDEFIRVLHDDDSLLNIVDNQE